jgi:iron complex transport system substrate-binding protein
VKKYLFSLLLGVLLLQACAPLTPVMEADATKAEAESTAAVARETSQIEASPQGFIVTDALDREVKFSVAPRRIVLAGRGSTLIIDALYLFPEAKERLVTIGKGSQGPENFVKLIDPQVDSKPMLPPDVSPEQLLSLKPDVVILKSYNAENLGTPLENLGIAVVYVDFETPDQYFRDITTLGKLFQNESRAEEVIAYYQERLAFVEKGLLGLEDKLKPQQLLLYTTAKDGTVALNVAPSGWMQTLLVKMAGGTPVWGDAQLENGWTKVGLEQIAAWDADQIFIVDYAGDVDEDVNALKADPTWQSLRAIKDNMVFAFPKDFVSWDQADPRWVLGLMWMAKKTHPDRFPQLDIEKETQGFFEKMYGLSGDDFAKSIEPQITGSY